MKKKLFGFLVIATTVISMTSCGGGSKNAANEENQETTEVEVAETSVSETTVSEPEPQQKGYQPPFSFTAKRLLEDTNNLASYHAVPLEHEISPKLDYVNPTFEIQILKNGTYQGTTIPLDINHGVEKKFDPIKYTGKWTTVTRKIGEEKQKVYVIHLTDGQEWYIPEDGEYLYSDWQSCDDMKTLGENVAKIIEIKQE